MRHTVAAAAPTASVSALLACKYIHHASSFSRHRKKFSYEKLQRAFEEEVVHVKETPQGMQVTPTSYSCADCKA